MSSKKNPGRHSYIIESPKGQNLGDTSVTITRCSRTKEGAWIKTGYMTFPSHAEALSKILRMQGFQKELPVKYGTSNVIEYWHDPPEKA